MYGKTISVSGSLSILHCLRAPVGGLFRHVCDLATAQSEMGHQTGIICDARFAGDKTEASLRNLAESVCSLGVTRLPMSRQLGWRDLTAARKVYHLSKKHNCQVLHGHGAKGGAYARLASGWLKKKGQENLAFYTPHGGSLHYDPASLQGRVFMGLERRLANRTDGLIFESTYSSEIYQANVAPFPCETRVIHNGLRPEEFYSVILDVDACEFVFVGELRKLKGVDIFLKALAEISLTHSVKAFIAGGGPDEREFRQLARKLKISDAVVFAGPTPAQTAFSRGQCLVVPSRAESLPYIILEAAAARLPFIATNVGGISEIVAGSDVALIEPDDVAALKARMLDFLENPSPHVLAAEGLQEIVKNRFNIRGMAQSVTHFYVARLLDHQKK